MRSVMFGFTRTLINNRMVSTIPTTATLVRTITAEDVGAFVRLSGDSNPVHIYSESRSSKIVVHGAFLNSLVSSLLGTKMPGPGAIVVEQTLRFPSSCFVGETVTIKADLAQDRKIMKVLFRFVYIADGNIYPHDCAKLKKVLISCRCTVGSKVVLEGDAKLVWNK